MGLLSWRNKKIAANAAEHMEPGEEIRAMVMTQTGQTAMATATRSRGAASAGRELKQQQDQGELTGEEAAEADANTRYGRVHAVAVTDRHVYSFFVPAFTGVGGVREKAPLGEADVQLEGKILRFNGVEYHVLFLAGKDAQAVADLAASG